MLEISLISALIIALAAGNHAASSIKINDISFANSAVTVDNQVRYPVNGWLTLTTDITPNYTAQTSIVGAVQVGVIDSF